MLWETWLRNSYRQNKTINQRCSVQTLINTRTLKKILWNLHFYDWSLCCRAQLKDDCTSSCTCFCKAVDQFWLIKKSHSLNHQVTGPGEKQSCARGGLEELAVNCSRFSDWPSVGSRAPQASLLAAATPLPRNAPLVSGSVGGCSSLTCSALHPKSLILAVNLVF